MLAIRSLLMVAAGALALTACTSHPLMNLQDRIVPNRLDGSEQTADRVQRGILAGCLDKGWTCREVTSGLIQASIDVRKHQAIADIAYDADSYSITYKSSQMLDYDSRRNTIHRNYNRWVNNLDAAIKKRLTL